MLQQALTDFLVAIADDPRICGTHICVYTALLKCWHERDYKNPISVFSREVMQFAKISSGTTYHRSIKQLNEYGYIKYESTRSHITGSLIYLDHPKNNAQ